jgi:FKBP-type peptidyl-prolyl cis-trans isomerase 2
MSKAKSGDTVKVHYTGKLDDGTVFDSSAGEDPLEFTIGEQHVIPGFEDGVVGMATGETKSISIEVDEAYGEHRTELVFEIERSQLPENIEPEVGQLLEFKQPDGSVLPLVVSQLSDESITLDANHPLAGKALTFERELVEIAAA